MSISENYIPQSENLEHFTKIVNELRSITDQNSHLKNGILTKVDLLIRQLNNGHVDNSDIIEKLNGFISQFAADVEISNDPVQKNETEVDGEKLDEKAQLLEQNKKLKEILASKIRYNEDVEQLNKEYQDTIDQVMKDVRLKKYETDQKKIQNFRKVHQFIQVLQDEEFETYLKTVDNQEILYKLGQSVSEVSQFLENNYENEVELNKLLTTLDLYKSEILMKPSKLRAQAWVNDYTRRTAAKPFVPSSVSNPSSFEEQFPAWR